MPVSISHRQTWSNSLSTVSFKLRKRQEFLGTCSTHKDFRLPIIAEFMEYASKTYFDSAPYHSAHNHRTLNLCLYNLLTFLWLQPIHDQAD